jgi:hypothetical protein
MKIYRTLAGCTFAIVSALIVVGEEQRSYPETEKNDVVLAQATASQLQIPTPPPSSGSTVRGASPSGSGGFSPEGLNPPASSSATARLSDMDLSGRTSPRQSPRSLSQFSSANRGSTAFRPPNIFGDFFGGQSDRLTLLIPVSYSNAPASNLGPNAFGFDVAGSSVLDIFSQGLPSSQGVYSIAEPLNPTAAYIPTNDGLTGYQFNDGTATPTNINQSNFDIEYSYSTSVNAPNSLTGLYGRQKIAENVSPIPQNRLFLNYSYFNETRLDNGLDVKRWSPGFESLVGSEWTSFEMRLPMATTLSSNIFNDVTDRTSSEVGNLYLALKQMMYRGEDSAISIGMSMTLPTADDLNIFVRSSTFGVRKILEIDNQSVHILPFVGWYRGRNRFFTQGFAQLDLDLNGNPVSYNPNFNQAQLVNLGTLQDVNFFYFDMQSGYRFHEVSPNEKARGCTSAAVVTELHWNRSLGKEDALFYPNGISLGPSRDAIQVLNFLVGLNVELNHRSTLGFGYATPIGNGPDHEFKNEGRFFYNRYF